MTDSVRGPGAGVYSSGVGDFEDIDSQPSAPASNTGALSSSVPLDDWVLGEDINMVQNTLKTASYDPEGGSLETQSPGFKEAVDNLRAQKQSFSLGRFLGRLFLSFANLFHKVSSSETLDTQKRLNELRDKDPAPLPEPEGGVKKMPRIELKTLGKLAGFGDNVNVKLFGQKLFSEFGPKLSDIKQDPNLQDCWFLSSVASVLSTQGQEAITRLFTKADDPDYVNVRLGDRQYQVPLGRICCGNEQFGSQSAPWVVVLENAMLMHLAAGRDDYNSTTTQSASIQNRNGEVGLKALTGVPLDKHMVITQLPLGRMSGQDAFQHVKDALDQGKPAVLGHSGNIFTAMYDGISPHHAISVVDVEENRDNPEKSKVIVLDPYGKVKELTPSQLKRCTLYV